ncbi:MAG: hypothetical protein Q9214_000932 [Letrouitia sp. 1 TL-2023]
MDASGLVVTGLAICFEVASLLYSYGKQVKGARRDIQNLSNELFGLIGALEHVKIQQEHHAAEDAESSQPPPYHEMEIDDTTSETDYGKNDSSINITHPPKMASVLKQTIEFLRELQQSLVEPKGRLNAAMHLMKWPLRESEVQRHLDRLERVKTYFVLSLVTDEVDQSRKMANEIHALRTLVQDTSFKQQAVDFHNEHQALVEWLCPVDPSVIRRNIDKTRMPGTGIWFTKSDAFQRQSKYVESSCFWLNGITGAGKTTLITAAIGELLASHEGLHNVAYFYCSFSHDESLHTHNVLGSILAQICTQSDPVYGEIRAKYATSSKKSSSKPAKLDVGDLVDLIIRQAQCRQRLHLVIDGINECSDPYNLLQAFEKILTSASGVQLLISSINEKGIEKSIDHMPKTYEVTISPKNIRHDINLLVYSALETHPRLRALPLDLKSDISVKLTDGAEGMLRTPGAVKKALSSLPPTLDKTYESILGRIDEEEDRVLTRQILELLAFSLRPLRLTEVCIMLQITPGMQALDESKSLTQPKDILDICGSLLKYNEKLGTVTLAHHSVKMYLMSSPGKNASFFKINAQEAHRTIALFCLTYLSFSAFNRERHEPSSLLCETYPFLDYATFFWALHMQEVTDLSEPLWSTLRSFLLSGDDGRQNFNNWVNVLVPDSKLAKTTTPLYYAASYGLTNVVKFLLSIGVDTEVHGGRGGATPINIAAYRGHLDVVKLLHKHGADPLKPDLSSGLNAVRWAYYQRELSFLILSFLLAITLASPFPGSGSSPASLRANQNLRNSRKKEETEIPKLPETKAFITDPERDSIVETFKDDSVDPPDADNDQCAVAMIPQDFPSQKHCLKVADKVYACSNRDNCVWPRVNQACLCTDEAGDKAAWRKELAGCHTALKKSGHQKRAEGLKNYMKLCRA